MSFGAAFHTFSIKLVHVDRDLFPTFRLKVVVHPNESSSYLFARMIALLHSYQDTIEFSQGLFDEDAPTILCSDPVDGIKSWIQVGVPTKRKLEVALRHSPTAKFTIYFYDQTQIAEFCQMLKGSKTNWVSEISFYLIPPGFLEQLAPLHVSSPTWQATFIDDHLYLLLEKSDLETDIHSVDIWSEYQTYLATLLQSEDNL